MPRPEPKESIELELLRKVMFKDEAEDDKEDVALGRYRERMNNKPEWVHEQLRIAEREYRKELADWQKAIAAEEKEARTAARETPKKGGKVKDIGTAKCLEKLDKLIGELTGDKK